MSDLPVADPWFTRTHIDETVTLLVEPHVNEMLRCNVWHVRGRERDLLVDTGLGLASLTAAGADLFGPDLLAVATHAHVDHIGGLHEFDDRAVHALEAATVAAIEGTLRLDVSQADEAELDLVASWGYDVREGLLTAVPYDGFVLDGAPRHATTATVVLEDGDVIDLGDRAFEVLHLPGHSPGSIGLWDPATGLLFAGDAVYDGPLLDEIEGADIDAYLQTMRRLRRLPVETAHGGHGPSMDRRRLHEVIDAYLDNRGG
jgi:glyoxylase-like metal-dependent hydrolase (beta-lactamase superfamily II)